MVEHTNLAEHNKFNKNSNASQSKIGFNLRIANQ